MISESVSAFMRLWCSNLLRMYCRWWL